MTILEDTRQQANKHELKHQYFKTNNIKVIRSKLPVGDYALLTDLSLCIDTKKDIQEVIGNVTSQHKRFVAECDLAKENGIRLIILVEDKKVACINDLYSWYNYRLKTSPKAITGKQLAKILTTIQQRHGVEFMFCKPTEAGKRIVELLKGGF